MGVGVGLERGGDLIEGAHTREAVAVNEIVVQQRQGQAGHERVHPDGQAGQFHRHPIAVHSVHAVAGDLPT